MWANLWRGWVTLDADTKTKLQIATKANPTDRASIGDTDYTPTRSPPVHVHVHSPFSDGILVQERDSNHRHLQNLC